MQIITIYFTLVITFVKDLTRGNFLYIYFCNLYIVIEIVIIYICMPQG